MNLGFAGFPGNSYGPSSSKISVPKLSEYLKIDILSEKSDY